MAVYRQCQFERLTIIYGLNTYGKSTLVDILSSLSTNDSSKILDRKSIGNGSTGKPKVTIKMYDESNKEKDIVFSNSTWQGFNNNYEIEIFDNKYIQNNIFAGLDITRENKLNITEFILGDENVKLANGISDLKRQKRDMSSKIKIVEGSISKVLPQNVRQSEFLALNVRDNCSEILKENIKTKDILENKIKFSQKILDMKKVNSIKVDTEIISGFKEINRLLTKTYDDINNEALEKITYHLCHNFSHSDSNSELWIKDGVLKYYKENNSEQSRCPFCGQIILNSEDLIDVYKRYFSDTYQHYSENLIGDLRKMYKDIKDKIKLINNSELKDNLISLKGFFQFIIEKEFKENVDALESLSVILNSNINSYINELNILLDQIEVKAKLKKEKPYEVIDVINVSSIENMVKNINSTLISINDSINKINSFIDKTKKPIENDDIKKQFKDAEQTISKLELEQLRGKCKELCNSLFMLERDQKNLSADIANKQEELKSKMNDFLNLYFDKINKYLQVFGTKNFQIERKISTNGDMPVISLCVKFKGEEINEKNLKNVLSESDIRALALSIFWSKLYVKPKESLQKTIVVLDDPITSFDGNRIRATITEIFRINEKCTQNIVLSHYENFVSILLSCYNGNCDLKVVKINKDNKTSFLENSNYNEFLLEAHDKNLEKIDRFISREISDDISKDIRVYFENEIKRRYRYQILKLNLENLMMKDLVLDLHKNDIIDNKIKEKILDFLRVLNPEHHAYVPSNVEEWRVIADDVLNFIFGVLTVTQNKSNNIV